MAKYELDHPSHAEAADTLDAFIFSGLPSRAAIKEFREYLAQWDRGLKEHEDAYKEEDNQDGGF